MSKDEAGGKIVSNRWSARDAADDLDDADELVDAVDVRENIMPTSVVARMVVPDDLVDETVLCGRERDT